jgi:hypothetical protein
VFVWREDTEPFIHEMRGGDPDEREVDYERVIAERLRTPAAQLRVA